MSKTYNFKDMLSKDEETYKNYIRGDESSRGKDEKYVQKRFDYLKSIEHYWDCKCEWCI